MNHSIRCKNSESLHLSKFSIQVFDVKLNCEECGVEYPPLHNFCIIRCCGEEKRCCIICNWETVPCQSCRDNNIGDIIIGKKRVRGVQKKRKYTEKKKKERRTFKTQYKKKTIFIFVKKSFILYFLKIIKKIICLVCFCLLLVFHQNFFHLFLCFHLFCFHFQNLENLQ